jgi:uncharacterized membrane-anchored protein
MNRLLDQSVSKVPEITLAFWIIKILATTLGETGGDSVSMTLNLGYLDSTFIFMAIFLVSVMMQIKAKRYYPYLYWFVIVATTTAGTTLADFADRSLGIGYQGGSLILFTSLMAVLGLWYWSEGTVSVTNIRSFKAEMFYWLTIMFSQTLGTALGDWMADNSGLGYVGAAIIFGLALAIVAGLWFYTRLSRTFLFWAAFILTRPLGATLGDFLDKPFSDGGLNLSRPLASLVLLLVLIGCVVMLPQRAGRYPGYQ